MPEVGVGVEPDAGCDVAHLSALSSYPENLRNTQELPVVDTSSEADVAHADVVETCFDRNLDHVGVGACEQEKLEPRRARVSVFAVGVGLSKQ